MRGRFQQTFLPYKPPTKGFLMVPLHLSSCILVVLLHMPEQSFLLAHTAGTRAEPAGRALGDAAAKKLTRGRSLFPRNTREVRALGAHQNALCHGEAEAHHSQQHREFIQLFIYILKRHNFSMSQQILQLTVPSNTLP